MADEELLDLEPSTPEEDHTNKVEKRIKDLSGKVRSTSEERDVEKARADKAEAERQTAVKDADFYKNFSTVSSKYQGSAEYQEQIRERVNKGYDLEEATVAVMAKEGKFSPPIAPQAPNPSPAGGSAVTNLKQGGDKSAAEMTQAERRNALMEAEKRGDLGLN